MSTWLLILLGALGALTVLGFGIGRVEVRTCRVCGCTDERGCPSKPVGMFTWEFSSCWWVDIDLCSRCAA